MSEHEKIYPTLPSAPPVPEYPPNSNDFRMIEINRYRNDIDQCISKYESILKSKKRLFNILHYTNTISSGLSGLTGASSVAILALGIGTGVGIPLVAIGLGTVATSLISSSIVKTLATKIKKYEKLLQSAKSSYLTISGILSTALIDEEINLTEFKVIQKEYELFSKNLSNIKSKHRVKFQDVSMQMQLQNIQEQIKQLKQK